MYSNTSCPGEYLLSKMDYIIEEANKINNQQNSVISPLPKKSNEEIAREVIAGIWGNGNDRKVNLANAGYNYDIIQKSVNAELNNTSSEVSTKKSNETIAQEIIKGQWGNGEDRKNKVIAAGYDYVAIQKIVNDKLK